MNNDGIVMAAGALMVAAVLLPVFKSPELAVSGSSYKRIWAAGMLTLFLAGANDVVPEVTGPLALSLILVTVVKSGLFTKQATPAQGGMTHK
jgi:hypothetical protein